MTDPIAHIRRYTDPKSQAASDAQAEWREANAMSNEPMKSKDPGPYWMRQYEKAFPNV